MFISLKNVNINTVFNIITISGNNELYCVCTCR